MIVHREAAGAIETLDTAAWRAQLLAQAAAGLRPLTVYGRPEGDLILVTSVMTDGASLTIARTAVDAQHGYHELTTALPAMHCFERELHEQHGVRIAGHPWLKPIRHERGDQAAMAAYPYYRVAGKEVHEVAVGPIHAGVIEPGSFRFMCYGEHVLHLEIQLGYQHRGVEARLLEREARALAPWVETIAGDTSVANAWAYAAAIELLADRDAPAETALARAVVLELERIAMHLAGLSGLAADVGFLPGASTYGRLRTTAINTTMRLCGSRFGRGAVRPGGGGVRLDAELLALVRANLALLRTDTATIDAAFLGARSVRHRLTGVGAVSAELAGQLGLVGLVARSCGLPIDLRRHGVAPRLETGGDCLARAAIRIAEIAASLDWLDTVLAEPRAWEPSRAPVPALAPGQLVVSAVEGWRGEVVHCLETDAAGALLHYKVQDPSLRNWMGLALAVRNNEISDFPICNKSFDLSYCGNDL